MKLFTKVINLLKEKEAEDIQVIGGGIIPNKDIEPLKKAGIKEIFTPGTPPHEMIAWINKNCNA